MKPRLSTFNLLFITFFFVGPFSLSAQMIALSTDQLTHLSENVIIGKVEKTAARWSDDRKAIITSATVQITNVIRGNVNKSKIIVEYPGGEIGNIGFKVSDISPLKTGEDVVLFLTWKNLINDSVFKIAGKAQGHYTIDKDGIARKSGFSVIGNKSVIDNNVPINELIDKIRKIK